MPPRSPLTASGRLDRGQPLEVHPVHPRGWPGPLRRRLGRRAHQPSIANTLVALFALTTPSLAAPESPDGAPPLGAPSWTAPPEGADLTGDGVPDALWEVADGGSGYAARETCARDGATGSTTCAELAETAYAPFAGLRVRRDGAPLDVAEAAADPLGALVLPLVCAPPDPASPRQGAMWRLREPSPPGGVMDLPPLRVPGPPQPQERVCMAPAVAAPLAGAFAWEPSGALDAAAAARDGWLVAWLFAGAPVLELKAGPVSLYRSHAAVAAWHRDADVHGWLVNLADGSEEGFKIDRWQRLSGFRQDGESASIKVAHTGLPQRLVIDLRTWRP